MSGSHPKHTPAHTSGSKRDFPSLLKAYKLKVTPARLAILEAFSADCEPMSAEIVFKRIQQQGSPFTKSKSKSKSINLVTIYRTITSLEKAHIIHRVDLHKDSVYYEFGNHHHHHIVCMRCGLIERFDECNIDAISKKALSQSSKFKAINKHSLELFGVCKKCAR